MLVYHRRRTWPFLTAWIVVGIAATALYMHNYDSHTAAAPHSAALTHPLVSLKFFAVAIGDVLGIPFHYGQASNPWLILFGLLIMAVALGVIVVYGIRRDDRGGGPFAVALILMGLLFAATVTEGRVIFGAWAASASRYTTFDLLVPVGIYLALLGRAPAAAPVDGGTPDATTGMAHGSAGSSGGRSRPPGPSSVWSSSCRSRSASRTPSKGRGPTTFTRPRRSRCCGASITPAMRRSCTTSTSSGTRPFIRHQAETLERHHLNVFAGDPQAAGVRTVGRSGP